MMFQNVFFKKKDKLVVVIHRYINEIMLTDCCGKKKLQTEGLLKN